MKKFGTPILAAPGSASECEGSLCAGGFAWLSGTGVGVAFARGTFPVSDSVLAPPETWSTVSCTVFPTPVPVLGRLGVRCRVLPLPVRREAGVDVGRGDDVGVGATTVGAIVAVGVGVLSTEPRS